MRLKEVRELKGLTQDQIARRLCVTRQAVSRWENGKTQPDIQTITKLSEIYNCSIDELVMDSDVFFVEEISKETNDFNKLLTWLPIVGFLYSLYYLLRYKSEIRIDIKKAIIFRIMITVFIVGAFVFSYISFLKLLNQ